jgi:aryl-alcohol dehydrogenase-like predicted oxidoreductase
VPEEEVRAILERAVSFGVRTLDTAAAYGDIESRLARLVRDSRTKVITKLPVVPAGMTPSDLRAWTDLALNSIEERLGGLLYAVLFHRAEDLQGDDGESLWSRCETWARARQVKLGVSVYDPPTYEWVCKSFPVSVVQLPGNALDQRLNVMTVAKHQEIHVRSPFLQGLLLMPEAEAVRAVPRAAEALRRWHSWLNERTSDAVSAALGLVKGLAGASHCVVGVDSLAQLDAVACAWSAATPLRDEKLASSDLDVIDPRRWPPRR